MRSGSEQRAASDKANCCNNLWLGESQPTQTHTHKTMAVYEKAKKAEQDQVKHLVSEHYEHFLENKVTFEVVMAHGKRNEEDELLTPALKDRGHVIFSKSKVNNLENRSLGTKDCRIILDADHWKDAGEKEKAAILDHALSHFQLCETVEGDVKFDDLGRPKLRLVHADYMLKGFTSVAARHGLNSIEIDALKEVQKLDQMEFAFKKAA